MKICDKIIQTLSSSSTRSFCIEAKKHFAIRGLDWILTWTAKVQTPRTLYLCFDDDLDNYDDDNDGSDDDDDDDDNDSIVAKDPKMFWLHLQYKSWLLEAPLCTHLSTFSSIISNKTPATATADLVLTLKNQLPVTPPLTPPTFSPFKCSYWNYTNTSNDCPLCTDLDIVSSSSCDHSKC